MRINHSGITPRLNLFSHPAIYCAVDSLCVVTKIINFASHQMIQNIMWKPLILCLLLTGFVSCAGTKSKSNESAAEEAVNHTMPITNIQGLWEIENVVANDSSYVRPSEIEPSITSYIDFREDNTFGVMTNCNHIGGQYRQTNDSLFLTDISTTEMACDNMELEEMLKKVLPLVNTIDCINDSITRLNSEKGETYIVLKKRIRGVK